MTTTTYRKYTEAERKKIYPRIITLHNAGLGATEIAHQLEDEGYHAPGGKPLTGNVKIIHQVLTRFRAGAIHEHLLPKGLTAAKKTHQIGRLPDTVLGVLTDPTLNDTQKVRMICAYAEVGND